MKLFSSIFFSLGVLQTLGQEDTLESEKRQLISCPSGWQAASWTNYQSYPSCCRNSPTYDPNADKSECAYYSGCDWMGSFGYAPYKRSFENVRSNDLVAFFTVNGNNAFYGGKNIRIMARGKTITAQIADTCGDADCNGCCSRNARPSGNLIDMEYWTVKRHFGDGAAFGEVCWQLATGPAPMPAPQPTPSASGTCGNGNRGNLICANGQCCSQWGWCGTSSAHYGGGGGTVSKLSDWSTCSVSSQCNSRCCSGKYSNGVRKCTPLGSNFDAVSNGCVSGRLLRGNETAFYN